MHQHIMNGIKVAIYFYSFFNFRENWNCSQSVVPPITMTSNFIMSGTAEVPGEFLYGRYGNPSRDALEATLAALEDAKYALAFSSGIVFDFL